MTFKELNLIEPIMHAVAEKGYVTPTPIQEQAIPPALEGRDLMGCAQTGTGKTAAYTLPLLNRLLLEGNEDNVIKSVIIVPTRELAQQIDQQFQGFSYYLPISTTVVYGGGDGKGWDVQKRGMLMGSDVVIATPGRMISHIQNSGIDLSHVECLILDEADRMLDMGFSEDIMKIVSYMPKERQTIMFSATLPPKIRELAKTILRNPAEVNIAISKPNEAIDQSAYVCYENQKLGIIREMFAEPTESKTIIFSSSKMKVKELAHTLKRMKLNVAAMHSDLEQAQREEVMLDFKNNKVSILVATDIVARGIDIEDIGLVINYDVPHDPEDYIHRIGRTARAAATGAAVTFVMALASVVAWSIQTYVLVPLGIEYMQTIVFILVIAALVQMVEIMLKKVSPSLYQALGIFLPLITTNCAVLGVAILMISKEFNLLQSIVYSVATAIGFALALMLFAGIRERLELEDVPKAVQGVPVALITAGILAMAFMGFSGLV